jgi:hypothetical protein
MSLQHITNLSKIALPNRTVNLYMLTAQIPENADIVVAGLAKMVYEDATDLACAVNAIEDIDDGLLCSDLAIDFALALILTNYDDLLNDDEREMIISEYALEGRNVAYDKKLTLWYATTADASFTNMAVA